MLNICDVTFTNKPETNTKLFYVLSWIVEKNILF